MKITDLLKFGCFFTNRSSEGAQARVPPEVIRAEARHAAAGREAALLAGTLLALEDSFAKDRALKPKYDQELAERIRANERFRAVRRGVAQGLPIGSSRNTV